MPQGKLARIVSFSTEDPKYPASNLLKSALGTTPTSGGGGGSGRWKWKCKEPGEPSAWVTVQLEQISRIVGLNFGNEGSAFVEVQVGRSRSGGSSTGSGDQEFKVLLSSTSLMTPKDSREETNLSRVRSLGSEGFDKEVAAEKWDLVKFICSQPFNRHLKYGLSFIEVRVPDELRQMQNGSLPKKIGSFSLRSTPITGATKSSEDLDAGEDDIDPVRIGAFFAKRQAQNSTTTSSSLPNPLLNSPTQSLSISAQIRRQSPTQASATTVFVTQKNCGSPNPNTKNSNDSPSARPKSTASTSNSHSSQKRSKLNPSSGSPLAKPVPDPNKNRNQKTMSLADDSDENSDSSSSDRIPIPHPKRQRKHAPFSRLFSDVTFVMSGYENPRRGEIRRKAVEMGGRCVPDWNSRCTHLVCAFINTPKFRAVRAATGITGKIVTEKWIEDSYDAKTRFPWRRYCLDRNDLGSESEEEIFAQENDNENGNRNFNDFTNDNDNAETESVNTGNPQSKDRKRKRSDDSNSKHKHKHRARIISSSSSEDENDQNVTTGAVAVRMTESSKLENVPNTDIDKDNEAYEADTDVESTDGDGNDTETDFDPQSQSRAFFSSMVFYFHDHDSGSESQNLHQKIVQIIHQNKGLVQSSLDENVSSILTFQTNWTEEFTEALSENPNLTILNQNWILECEKQNSKVPMNPFILKQR